MMVFIFLLKEVLNCIDEFVMGAGKTIEVSIKDKKKTVAVTGLWSWNSLW
jgi:DNA gyrase/topoisomerase IV subunit B